MSEEKCFLNSIQFEELLESENLSFSIFWVLKELNKIKNN